MSRRLDRGRHRAGFKINGTPHGVRNERTGRLKIGNGVSESDDEDDPTTGEETGALEVPKESGSSDNEMDWTIDEKMEGLMFQMASMTLTARRSDDGRDTLTSLRAQCSRLDYAAATGLPATVDLQIGSQVKTDM